ncbi:hypothetical protein [Embleya sp. MST-111070]|uniref:hypothetical protein n=1 Tax=Embleya sp. MST-111070 TaxID=3398231 RepID=UPI003F738750
MPLTSDRVAWVTDLNGCLPDNAEEVAEWAVRICTTDGDHVRTVPAPGADDPRPTPRLLALARAVRLVMYEEQGRTPV